MDTNTIKIMHHSFENQDCENHIRTIAKLPNMPEYLSVDCDCIESIRIDNGMLLIYVKDVPARIDYDKHFGTLHILSQTDVQYYPKPYSLIPKKNMSTTLWEPEERELAKVEGRR